MHRRLGPTRRTPCLLSWPVLLGELAEVARSGAGTRAAPTTTRPNASTRPITPTAPEPIGSPKTRYTADDRGEVGCHRGDRDHLDRLADLQTARGRVDGRGWLVLSFPVAAHVDGWMGLNPPDVTACPTATATSREPPADPTAFCFRDSARIPACRPKPEQAASFQENPNASHQAPRPRARVVG
jgi:hypothetical protein